jgi:hypothetical protein
MLFFKRYPKEAKYRKGDFVNFRRRGELWFGWIYDAKRDKQSGAITYTIQIGGQCPSFVYEYKEEDIIGLKKD